MADEPRDPEPLTLEQALAEVQASIQAGTPIARLPAPIKHEDVVRFLATNLGETEPEPLQEMADLVKRLGECGAINILRRVDAIERKGGRFVKALGRRRTRGGVWFWLARERLRTQQEAAAATAKPVAAPAAPPVQPAAAPKAKPQAAGAKPARGASARGAAARPKGGDRRDD